MRVVILGGGYAAVWCHRALRRGLGERAQVTVVAPFDHHAFHGFTGEVLDGELAPGLEASPLDECLPGAARIRGRAVAVDAAARTVTVEAEEGRVTLAYDELVVAIGAGDRTSSVPGLEEHGLTLRSPGSVPALLARLEALATEPAPDREEADRRGTVVVVGAGFAGTEVAAALGRRYGDARRVVLVSSAPTVVPQWAQRPRLQRSLLRNLDEAGVELRLAARVVRVDAAGVVLAGGERIEAATVVSALGNRARELPGLEAHRDADGSLRVDEHLRVTDGVWAAGDAAAVRRGGERVPQEALWAIRAGTRVGRSIVRTARGARPVPFRFRGLGSVVAFAPGRAVAVLHGVALPQLVGWVVRAVLFLWYVPSRRAALRIVRWSLQPRTLPAAAPIRVAQPVPVLVALPGGVSAADRLRAALVEEQPATARVSGAGSA